MPFSQKCVKIASIPGPVTQLDKCVISLSMMSKPQGINWGESLLRFVENGASARHFQPLSEEDDKLLLLLSDCAMFCSAHLW